ncbi:MAG: type II toxin-antitoxin system Phd/YefM family antitoxin [Candidatus Omnitrophica bacterium]|nr:type II toxin-antitoxin system Phd/YefM family antitoxin [Candidatus Omnitrophota bacterium]
MTKTITASELASNLADVMDSVRLHGDRYVVEDGKGPVAAIVPVSEEEAGRSTTERLVHLMETVAERNRDIPPETIAAAIDQAVREVRADRRQKA